MLVSRLLDGVIALRVPIFAPNTLRLPLPPFLLVALFQLVDAAVHAAKVKETTQTKEPDLDEVIPPEVRSGSLRVPVVVCS